MKKFILIVILSLFTQFAIAGGLLTNYNQSIQYTRMQSRNASFQIDAVFYNPAGLVFMENGWHFAFHTQTIWQDYNVDSEFPLLKDGSYTGKVFAPIFPDIYAVYKMDKWAFSIGFTPIGGGGGAEYEDGLPSFETDISKLPLGLKELAQIDPVLGSIQPGDYNADISFEGSSVFYGLQVGATYKINEQFSVFGGARYVIAQNTYEGSIKNIQVKKGDAFVNAKDLLNGYAGQLSNDADMLAQSAGGLQELIDNNAGAFTLVELQGAGYINAQTKSALEDGLKGLGLPEDQINAMNVATIQGTFLGAADQLGALSGELSKNAEDVRDRKLDSKQTGTGITPIIGVNYRPTPNWLFAVKYEFETKLELENDTDTDEFGLFPDGAKSDSDMPALLALGVGYNNEKYEVQLSYQQYFDSDIKSWGLNARDPENIVERDIDNNFWEIGLGGQYNLNENFGLSTSALWGNTGISPSYQTDLSHSESSLSLAFGCEWKINEALVLDAGLNYTWYVEDEITINDADVGPYKEIYDQNTFLVGIGLTYSIYK